MVGQFYKFIFLTFFCLLWTGNSWSQTYNGCADLSAGDFQVSTFNVGNRPISVDFHKKTDGTFDSYFARLGGQVVRRTSGGQQSTVASLGVSTIAYGGLTSFLLHPDYETNGWAFTLRMIATPGWSGPNYRGAYTSRIARHDFNASTGQLSNEKVLIDIPQIGVKNNGGDGSLNRAPDGAGSYAYFQNSQMRFDGQGNLYANLGADHRSHESYVFTHDQQYLASSGEARASNTNWLNGILRIHPDNSQKGYSIPINNFREYWEKYFIDKGNSAAAAEYAIGAGKVAPEVFTKGHRTNWTLKTHPTKNWLIWGEVGVTSNYDEIGIVKHPVFAGYPYYYGNNEVSFRYYPRSDVIGGNDKTQNASLLLSSRADTNAPRNLSPLNDGATYLPPAFNPQLTSQRFQSESGGVSLADVGLRFAVQGFADQIPKDDWFEAPEKAQTALPPVDTRFFRYSSITAGGIYAFDLALNNNNKFPPHLDEYLFIFDWEQNVADVAKVREIGDRIIIDTVIDLKTVLGLGGIGQIIDASFTPHGTLMLSAEGGLIREVRYTGNCVRIDTSYVGVSKIRNNHSNRLHITNKGISLKLPGSYQIKLYNGLGKLIQTKVTAQQGYVSFDELFPGVKGSEIYWLKVSGEDYRIINQAVLIL